jgi:hypothetical protein
VPAPGWLGRITIAQKLAVIRRHSSAVQEGSIGGGTVDIEMNQIAVNRISPKNPLLDFQKPNHAVWLCER